MSPDVMTTGFMTPTGGYSVGLDHLSIYYVSR